MRKHEDKQEETSEKENNQDGAFQPQDTRVKLNPVQTSKDFIVKAINSLSGITDNTSGRNHAAASLEAALTAIEGHESQMDTGIAYSPDLKKTDVQNAVAAKARQTKASEVAGDVDKFQSKH
jgi:hypothetical protein